MRAFVCLVTCACIPKCAWTFAYVYAILGAKIDKEIERHKDKIRKIQHKLYMHDFSRMSPPLFTFCATKGFQNVLLQNFFFSLLLLHF